MNLRHIITVEPVVFLFFTGNFLFTPALQQLALKKICEEMYKEEICSDLTYHQIESKVVQSKVSYFLLLYTCILTFMSIPPSIFLGSWSDQGHHKLGMTLPSVGALISGIILIVMVEVEGMSIYWCILGTVFLGLSGNYIAIVLSTCSYLSSITDEQNRTLRFGIMEAMMFIGGTVGFLLSGWLLQHYTFTHVFAVFCGCQLVSILYVNLWLWEPDHVPEQVMEVPPASSGTTQRAFIFSPFIKTWQSFSKMREGQNRFKLQLIFLCSFFINICVAGEQSIIILFLMYPPRHFTSELYGIFTAVNMFLSGVAMLCLFPLLLRCINEMTLAKMAILLKVASLVLLALSTDNLTIFLSTVLNCISGFIMVVFRSATSKIVQTNEQGAIFSCMSSMNMLCILIGVAIFDSLYPQTLTSFPGFSFIVMAGFHVIVLILTQWVSEIAPSNHPLTANGNNSE